MLHNRALDKHHKTNDTAVQPTRVDSADARIQSAVDLTERAPCRAAVQWHRPPTPGRAWPAVTGPVPIVVLRFTAAMCEGCTVHCARTGSAQGTGSGGVRRCVCVSCGQRGPVAGPWTPNGHCRASCVGSQGAVN